MSNVPDKTLYNDWEVSTTEGNDLFHETVRALEPIMKRWMEKGYPVRQISHEMISATTLLEAETRIRRNIDMHRAGLSPQKDSCSSQNCTASKEVETQNG